MECRRTAAPSISLSEHAVRDIALSFNVSYDSNKINQSYNMIIILRGDKNLDNNNAKDVQNRKYLP